MSLTKRWIDELRDRAAAGDGKARATLEAAGLWPTEDEADEAAAAFAAARVIGVGDYGGAEGADGLIYSDADQGL